MADAQVTGSGVDSMKLLAARLKDADPKLKRELRRRFKDAAEPVAGDVEQSILLMPSRHDGTLRREVAKTISLRTMFTISGVRVQIDSLGQKMPEGKGTLPHHLDSDKGWEHPVFGRPEPEAESVALQKLHGKGFGHGRAWTWRHQFGKPGWFEKPIIDNAREFRNAALAAIAETEKHLGA
jgi:hypothetical protein